MTAFCQEFCCFDLAKNFEKESYFRMLSRKISEPILIAITEDFTAAQILRGI